MLTGSHLQVGSVVPIKHWMVGTGGRRRSLRGRMRALATCAVLLGILALPHTCLAAPANDDFANAEPMTGRHAWTDGDTTGATVEPGEPQDGGPFTETTWYSYVAPVDGMAVADTFDQRTIAAITIFTGDSLANLQRLGGSNDLPYDTANFQEARARAVGVTVGEQLWVRIATQGFEHPYTVHVGTVPANDDQDLAQIIAPTATSLSGDAAGATVSADTGTADTTGHAGFGDLWYRADATFVLDSCDAPGSMDNLQIETHDANVDSFDGCARKYTVVPEYGPALLRVYPTVAPTDGHDAFSVRMNRWASWTRPAESVSEFTGYGPRHEPGDPTVAPDASGKANWWKVTSDRSGEVFFQVFAREDTRVAVYRKDESSFTLVRTCALGAGLSYRPHFHAEVGQEFRIGFDGVGGPPPNVSTLSGFSTWLDGSPFPWDQGVCVDPSAATGGGSTTAGTGGESTTAGTGGTQPVGSSAPTNGTTAPQPLNLSGTRGPDKLVGGPLNDLLYGGRGADLLYGGAGNDHLIGGPGQDRLYGGSGNDELDARDHSGGDIVSCGSGKQDFAYVDRGDQVDRTCERVHRSTH